jgi:hypothetical protein
MFRYRLCLTCMREDMGGTSEDLLTVMVRERAPWDLGDPELDDGGKGSSRQSTFLELSQVP